MIGPHVHMGPIKKLNRKMLEIHMLIYMNPNTRVLKMFISQTIENPHS